MLELGFKSPLLLFFFLSYIEIYFQFFLSSLPNFRLVPEIVILANTALSSCYPCKHRVILSLSSQTPRYPRLLMFILPTHNYRNCQASNHRYSPHISLTRQLSNSIVDCQSIMALVRSFHCMV